MSANALANVAQMPIAADIERVLVGGDLAKLSPDQRVSYYSSLCRSLGLNPLTKPFEYITLNGKLTLYARKDATDQLRMLRGVSIDKPEITFQDDWIIVSVVARDKDGRTDADLGVVNKKDMRGDYGNALMKAVTKAKRRVTLSICGLGMLDETEVQTIHDARPARVDTTTGEVVEAAPAPHDEPAATITQPQQKRFFAIAKAKGWAPDQLKAWLDRMDIHSTAAIRRADYDDLIAAIEAGPVANLSAPVAAATDSGDDDLMF